MIRSLRLQNFRCFDQASLCFPEEGAVILGANALGKTSILEAVCVLVRLHSPRSRSMGVMARSGESGFGIAGECWDGNQQVRYQQRKGVEMKTDDEKVIKQSDYLRSGGLLVWMGNDDLQLVRGSGSVRRRYLDFLGCQIEPEYRDHLHRYTRVLKARNVLLKEKTVRENELRVYTDLLVKHGVFLTDYRKQLAVELVPFIVQSQEAVSESKESVGMDYVSGMGDDFLTSLAMTSAQERRLGQTLVGPHRDQIKLSVNGMLASDFASEGQQRTMALSLKLAQGKLLKNKVGKLPVYLLDDIFGELDENRRNALMSALPNEAQKLITTTSLSWMEKSFSTIPIESVYG